MPVHCLPTRIHPPRNALGVAAHGGRRPRGSDFPFGETKPVEFVQSAAEIPAAPRDTILGADTARFLGVEI
jgi:hypothetical protein